MTVGIVKNPGDCPSVADSWPEPPAADSDLVVSPPMPLEEVARCAEVLILEPDAALAGVLAVLRPMLTAETALVCTSPLVSLDVIRSAAGGSPSVFRAVIPLGVGAGDGVAAVAFEPGTRPEAIEMVKAVLGRLGRVEVVAEDALDAIAALSIGGAAFLLEALAGLEKGAVGDGLPEDTARAFAHHTLLATALLLRDSGSPADLKDQVASPGGTTIAALASLEDAGVRGACLRAVQRSAVEVRRRRDAARSVVIE